MRLTLWTDYALRTLIYLGVNARRLSTIAEIAESFEISNAHLMKIVNQLAQQRYIETVRGKGGGIRLGRAAEQIGIGAVVRDTEEELAVMDACRALDFAELKDAACFAARCIRQRPHF